MDEPAERLALEEIGHVRARLDRIEQLIVGASENEVFDVPGQGPWTRADLEWLAGWIDELPVARVMLDLTALRPDNPITYAEVLSVAEAPDTMASRVDLQELSVRTRARFGAKRWPVIARQSASGSMQYRMPASVASVWLKIRNR